MINENSTLNYSFDFDWQDLFFVSFPFEVKLYKTNK